MMKKINQSLNTCIILVGVGRIYSIQGGGGQKGGGIFSKSRGTKNDVYAIVKYTILCTG